MKLPIQLQRAMAAEAEAAREARAKVMASRCGFCGGLFWCFFFSLNEELNVVVWRMKILFRIGLWQTGMQGRIFVGLDAATYYVSSGTMQLRFLLKMQNPKFLLQEQIMNRTTLRLLAGGCSQLGAKLPSSFFSD